MNENEKDKLIKDLQDQLKKSESTSSLISDFEDVARNVRDEANEVLESLENLTRFDYIDNSFNFAMCGAMPLDFQWLCKSLSMDESRQKLHYIHSKDGILFSCDGRRVSMLLDPDKKYEEGCLGRDGVALDKLVAFEPPNLEDIIGKQREFSHKVKKSELDFSKSKISIGTVFGSVLFNTAFVLDALSHLDCNGSFDLCYDKPETKYYGSVMFEYDNKKIVIMPIRG